MIALALALCAPAAAPPADPIVIEPIARIAPAARGELSGLAASRSNPGVLWALGDSGNQPRLYPVRRDGSLIAAEGRTPGVLVAGASNTDWEDVAIDASNRLIIADLGNNANARRDLALYLVPEPAAEAASSAPAVKVPVRYPDQEAFPPAKLNFDAEALFTVGDEIYILTKHRADAFTTLYRLDSRNTDRPNTLTYLDRFDAGGMVTAADASADGLRLAVLTYASIWVFERADARQPFFAGRTLRRAYKPPAGQTRQCESICFDSPESLLIADESRGELYRVALADLPEVAPARPLPKGDAADDLRIMSFNLRYANTHDGPNNWPLRQPLVGETIAAFDPDLLGCQEVLAGQADWLRERLASHTFFGTGRLDGRREGEFAPILARTDRFLTLASGVFWLSETPDEPGRKGWDAACERMATWARLRDLRTKRPILVLNTHLDHVGVEARRRGLELIGARLAVLADGAAVIVTGDFNSSADGPDAPRLINADSARPGLPLIDAFRAVYPARDRDEATFCEWRPTIEGDRIDWILASPAFTIIDAAIDRRMPEGRTPSDHYPVTAVLRPGR